MIATVTLNPSLDEWIRLPTLRLGRLNRARGFMRYPGGKGINVSRVICELGGSTVAYAFSGGDDGAILREGMRVMGIPCDFTTVRGSTRNNYKILTDRPRALTEVNAAGPKVSAADLRTLSRRFLERRPPPRCVTLAGSLPPGAPPTIYQRWIRALRRRGVPVVLDASGEALRRGLLARPWLIKPNRHEAEELLGRRLMHRYALVEAAKELLRRGPELILLSLGGEGALLACASPPGVWFAQPPAVKVDSAVGAGDSVVAGFLVGWSQSRGSRPLGPKGLLEALRLGVACGTATAMTPGTELCHRGDVRRISPRIKMHQVA